MGRRKDKPRIIPEQDTRICRAICLCQLTMVLSCVSIVYLSVAIYSPSLKYVPHIKKLYYSYITYNLFLEHLNQDLNSILLCVKQLTDKCLIIVLGHHVVNGALLRQVVFVPKYIQ